MINLIIFNEILLEKFLMQPNLGLRSLKRIQVVIMCGKQFEKIITITIHVPKIPKMKYIFCRCNKN